MRYVVKVAKENNIINIYNSEDYSSALNVMMFARKIYGDDNVWIADAVIEVLVG